MREKQLRVVVRKIRNNLKILEEPKSLQEGNRGLTDPFCHSCNPSKVFCI